MPIENLPPKECWEAISSSDGILIDVRTPMEFEQGHPKGAVNVPWVVPDPQTGGAQRNPDFVDVVKRVAGVRDRVFLFCHSGQRSLAACHDLEHAGFERLVNVAGGLVGQYDPFGGGVIAGWLDCGLPIATDGTPYEEPSPEEE